MKRKKKKTKRKGNKGKLVVSENHMVVRILCTRHHMDPTASNDRGKGPADPVPAEKDVLHMNFIKNNLLGLRQFRDSLSSEAKKVFRDRFGKIENIMDIEVDIDAIRAWIRHFDPVTGVFIFPKRDMAPTLDEYYYLAHSTWDKSATRPYLPDINKKITKESALNDDLQSYFGLKHPWFLGSKALEKGVNMIWIDWHKIFREMEKSKHKQDPGKQANFLALGICGLVLFPTRENMVDSRVMDAVIHLIKNPGAQLMGMVLAETLQTCDYIKKHKGGLFKCCTQLLTLWIHAHFPLEGVGKCKPWFTKEEDLVQQLVKQERRRMNELKWLEKLNGFKESEVTWQVSWLKDQKLYVIPPSGEYWLSLFGIFGAIRYSPGMVLRQFGGKQGIPAFSNKEQWDVEFKLGGRNLNCIEEMKAVWQGYERRDVIQGEFSDDYEGWRKNWILDQKMPKRPRSSTHLKWKESEERLQDKCRQNTKLQEENEKVKKKIQGITGERIRHTITLNKCKKLEVEVAAQKVQIRRGEGKLEAAWDDRKQDLREKKELLREVQELDIQYQDGLRVNKRLKNDKAKLEVEVQRVAKEKEEAEKMNNRSADQLAKFERAQDVSKLVERLQKLRREVMGTCELRLVAHQTGLRGFPQEIEQDEGVKKMMNEQRWMKRYISILRRDLFEIAKEACAGKRKPLEAWASVEARMNRLREDILGATL